MANQYGFRICSGANGYYIACEDKDGFHYQPSDNGARIGWDMRAARAALRRAIEEAEEEEEDNRRRATDEENYWSRRVAESHNIEINIPGGSDGPEMIVGPSVTRARARAALPRGWAFATPWDTYTFLRNGHHAYRLVKVQPK